MGRKKVKIAKIQDKAARTITFTKRRQGLFKKARELCVLCDVEIAIITFSPAGNPFTFSHPSIHSLIHSFNSKQPTPFDCSNANASATIPSPNPQLEPHVHNSSSRNSNRSGNATGYWWELVNVDDFVDERDLQQLKNALEGLRQGVYSRLLAVDLISCNESTLPCVPGGAFSSSLPDSTTEACYDLCGGLSEIIMQGNFGGQIPDF